MTMTKLNSAPPAVKVAMVEYAVTSDNYHFTATAPTVSGYTFVCWVDFRGTGGYGVWKAAFYWAATTDVWPQVPASVTTYPSGKKIDCYALYTRSSTVEDALADATVPDSYDDEIQEYVRQYIESGGIQLVQTVVDGDLRLSLA